MLNIRVDEVNAIMLARAGDDAGESLIDPGRFVTAFLLCSLLLLPYGSSATYCIFDSVKEDGGKPIHLYGDVLRHYLVIIYEPGVPPNSL
jgi:hypothetical protein